MHCPKCKQGNNRKSGVIKRRARYVCKSCNEYYTVEHRAGTADQETKRRALVLYVEGLGFRAIGRLLKFNNISMLKWIRSFGAQVQDFRAEKSETI
jgi:transposase-like protein